MAAGSGSDSAEVGQGACLRPPVAGPWPQHPIPALGALGSLPPLLGSELVLRLEEDQQESLEKYRSKVLVLIISETICCGHVLSGG